MAKGNFIEYVVSDNPNKYPNDGEQSGYYYVAMEDVTPEVTAQTPIITQIAENLGVTITTPSGTNKQILQGNNVNLKSIKANAKSSGLYLWTKRAMSSELTEDTAGGTNTVFSGLENIRTEILEYTTTAPTYNSSEKKWVFANSTKINFSNEDNNVPTFSTYPVYVRILKDANVWYRLNSGNTFTSEEGFGSYIKKFTYSVKYTASISDEADYIVGDAIDKYADGWKDDRYYHRYSIEDVGGKIWTKGNLDTDARFDDVKYFKGVYVAGSLDAKGIYYSTDGKTWVQSNVTTGSVSVECNNDVCVATGAGNIYYSTDGKTWTQSNVTNVAVTKARYANSLWVAAGNAGIWYSTDGKTWTKSTITIDNEEACVEICYGGGRWISVHNRTIYYSADGKNWTKGVYHPNASYCACYAKGIFIIGRNGGNATYSVDGISWTDISDLSSSVEFIIYENETFIACLDGGIYYSADGKSWTKSTNKSVTDGRFEMARFDGELWVASCNGNPSSSWGMYYSKDNGKTWWRSEKDIVTRNVFYVGGIWITGGNGGSYYSEAGKIGLLSSFD